MKLRTIAKSKKKSWVIGGILLGAGLLAAAPAMGLYGGGRGSVGGYAGPTPAWYFQEEVCPNGFGITYSVQTVLDVRQWEVDPVIVRDDGDPNTYLQCTITAILDEIICHLGMPDGGVITCQDSGGPHQLPRDGDAVYIIMEQDPADGSKPACEVVVGTGQRYGIADPKCRSASGGSNAPCNANTANAVLQTGQSTTLPSDSCVQLVNQPTWSTIDPFIQAKSGTASYPVPYEFSACGGSTGTGALTGNHSKGYMLDGPGVSANNGCDIFVRLQGTGTLVEFVYYQ